MKFWNKYFNDSLLHLAAYKKQYDVLKYLCSLNKIDINAEDSIQFEF